MNIPNKLVAARTRLILDQPFLGALTLRLPLQSADSSWCATTYTDAKTLFYNAEYIDSLTFEQLQFVLAGQALHCALCHFNRRGHRQAERWNTACDYAINLILVDEGLSPPPGALINDDYGSLTAEEIYPLLESSEHPDKHHNDRASQPRATQKPGDSNTRTQPAPPADVSMPLSDDLSVNQPTAVPKPQSLSETEKNTLQQQWQQRLAGAAQQAQQAGKLGRDITRMLELFLQPTLPWRALLARYFCSIARNDYSYARPSSRRGDPAIYPSLHGAQVDLVVAVDVSGSITPNELNEFMIEVDALKAQVNARVTLLTCDVTLTGECPWIFEAWENCQLPLQVAGGGGTNFQPVFEWVGNRDMPPDLLIYFTDGDGKFPQSEPGFPTLWLVKGGQKVPWGQRIQLN